MNKPRYFLALSLALILLSCDEHPVNVREPSIYIAKFPGDKRAAVSFTFDDNCASSLTKIVPLFDHFGFRSTFFIIPGTIKTPAEWSAWKAISDRGFEIGNHTMSHFDLTGLDSTALHDQIITSFELIKSNIKKTPLSFAPPGHRTNVLVNEVIAQKHPFNRADSRDSFVWQGWVSSTTQKDAREHIKEVIMNNGWYVVAAHGVGDGWEPISESMLRNVLEYCVSNEAQLVVESFENISLYTTAREHTTLWVNKGENYQTIKLESNLSSDIYDDPLTLVLENYQFPSPYRIYNTMTGETLEPKVEDGNRLLLQVYINNTYQIRWRDW